MLLADDARARAAGLTTRPTEDTVRATLAWWEAEGRHAVPLAKTLTADREAALLSSAGANPAGA
jgi:hypothetical protein